MAKVQTFKKSEYNDLIRSRTYRDYLAATANFEELAAGSDLKQIIVKLVRDNPAYKGLEKFVYKRARQFLSAKHAAERFFELVGQKVEEKKHILEKKDKTPEERELAQKVLYKLIIQSLQVAFGATFILVPIPGTGPVVLLLLDQVIKKATGGKIGIIPEGLYRIIQTMKSEKEEKDGEEKS